MVDYANEVECMYAVKFFDKDEDGLLTFEDYLQMTLPCDDVKARADAVQRPNYKVPNGSTLPKHLEYELSRLFEKEVHYHLKVEHEKKTLERQIDFSTVAAFSVIDQNKHGYIDFQTLSKFFSKFKKDVKKSDITAIIRRMDLDADGKITFREFSHGITPEYPGVSPAMQAQQEGTVVNPEFNIERKEEVRRTYEENKFNAIKERKTSASPLRDYRVIYNSNP